jgi:hypothetical protein
MATLRPACARAAVAALAGVVAACASVLPLPPDIDLRQATVEPLAIEPEVQLEEAGWRSDAATTGGLAGAGIGLGAGGVACLGTGIFAPLCFVTVVPLTTSVGAVGGAALGAAHSQAGPGVEEKQALLRREWMALGARAPLAVALQRHLALPAADADAPAARWHLQAGYATLGSVGRGLDQPFSVEATARLAVWRADRPRARIERTYVARGAERLTLAQWSADDALALRRALDTLSESLAAQMAAELARPAR